MTFQIPETAEKRPGESVEYSRAGELRAFEWNESSQGKRHVVRWNAETNAGSIATDDFNECEKACWGPDLKNTACPVL